MRLYWLLAWLLTAPASAAGDGAGLSARAVSLAQAGKTPAKPVPKQRAKGGKAKAKPAAPAPAPAATAADDDPMPPVHRTVIHSEAYKERENLGPHLSIKITPPEKRGKKGRVLVELYNYSTSYLSVVDFWLYLYSDIGEKVEVHITADDIKGGWSALKWVKIPKDAKMPAIVKVEIQKMQMYTGKAKKVKLKYFTDLIKA